MTLNEVKELIAQNPTKQVYVKWQDSFGSVKTTRIYRPLRTHGDGTISLEANGYVYYVLPQDILSVANEESQPPHYEDWFGDYGSDR